MISVVICSIDPRKFQAVKAMYAAAIGDAPWELIGIHDAKSAAEGYNRGIEQSRGDIVVFSHDDVEILSPDFPQRLAGHLAGYDIIGVAGTSLAVAANWKRAGPPYLLGQIVHAKEDGTFQVDIFGAPFRASRAQAVDGVFIAARRPVFDRVKFDAAAFDAFHGWDQDFCRSACVAGLTIGVACDINLLHFSHGHFDANWRQYAVRFSEKWRTWVEEMAPRCKTGFSWTWVNVPTRAECLAVMTPPYW